MKAQMKLKKDLITLIFASGVCGSAFAVPSSECVSGGTIPTGGFTCTVPAGITSMSLTLAGGVGGYGTTTSGALGGQGGTGALCSLTLNTVPGQAISITLQAGSLAGGGDADASGSGITGTVIAEGGVSGSNASGSLPGYGGPGGQGIGSGCFNGITGADGIARTGAAASASLGMNGYASLTFSAPVAPAPIPTLSEWGMIFMASLMAMFGIRRMRRSK